MLPVQLANYVASMVNDLSVWPCREVWLSFVSPALNLLSIC